MTWAALRRSATERVSEAPGSRQQAVAVIEKRRRLSPADNPLVRAVGRLPVRVHAKLLVAFVCTALLVVAVGLLGLRVLGQANTRAERLGGLQKHAFAYGQLQSDAVHVRQLLAENVAADFYKTNPSGASPRS